jgi:hypothetical protein
LRQDAAAAAALRQQLDAAQEQLAASKGQSDEVEYLQQQVRGRGVGCWGSEGLVWGQRTRSKAGVEGLCS